MRVGDTDTLQRVAMRPKLAHEIRPYIYFKRDQCYSQAQTHEHKQIT